MQPELLESIQEEGKSFMKKYENFCQALINMKDIYNYEEPYDNVVLTGLVGLYEITFEQSWKMMKIGYNKRNPADTKIAMPDFFCYIMKYISRISYPQTSSAISLIRDIFFH